MTIELTIDQCLDSFVNDIIKQGKFTSAKEAADLCWKIIDTMNGYDDISEAIMLIINKNASVKNIILSGINKEQFKNPNSVLSQMKNSLFVISSYGGTEESGKAMKQIAEARLKEVKY